jgi:hypothetical protein
VQPCAVRTSSARIDAAPSPLRAGGGGAEGGLLPTKGRAKCQGYAIVPILQQGEQPFARFVDLQNEYDWVLQPVIVYHSTNRLIEVLEEKIVKPAEVKLNELLARRSKQLRVEHV